MVNTVRSSYSATQMAIWLRGLLTIAWADSEFDSNEQRLIAALMDEEEFDAQPIAALDLAAGLGSDPATGENFLRTAVMVAIADGSYSIAEAQMIRQFSDALGIAPDLLDTLNCAIEPADADLAADSGLTDKPSESLSPFRSIQDWLDQVDVQDLRLAHFLCRAIPPQCPFERDLTLFGRRIAHIPPLCKLNPLYEQLVGLRFRALTYLADDCQEDVTPYC